METPYFFKNGGDLLFGVMHNPAGIKPRSGILLCHAFGEEKLWSQRVYVNTAREAANRGIAAFRFDFRGHGDSAGHSQDYDLASYISDIDAALREFRSKHPSVDDIGILGLRFGGTLAALYASQERSVGRLILWEPILDGSRYMQDLLRINLSTQLAVYGKVKDNRERLIELMKSGHHANVDGYLLCYKFFQDVAQIDLSASDQFDADQKMLVVQIATNIAQKERIDLVDMIAECAERDFLKVCEPPFWREIKPFTSRTGSLIRETLEWWEA